VQAIRHRSDVAATDSLTQDDDVFDFRNAGPPARDDGPLDEEDRSACLTADVTFGTAAVRAASSTMAVRSERRTERVK